MTLNSQSSPHSCNCRCCAGHTPLPAPPPGVSRRQFLYHVGALTAGGLVLSNLDSQAAEPSPLPTWGPRPKQPLKVQPVLTCEVPKRREATSWRNWGGIQTEDQAAS